jgi:hypothetical protein
LAGLFSNAYGTNHNSEQSYSQPRGRELKPLNSRLMGRNNSKQLRIVDLSSQKEFPGLTLNSGNEQTPKNGAGQGQQIPSSTELNNPPPPESLQ